MEGLRRRLGTSDAVVVGLGAMLGAGTFAAPGPPGAAARSGLLVALMVAAGVAYCNGMSSAWLTTRYPSSGGAYPYGRERLGRSGVPGRTPRTTVKAGRNSDSRCCAGRWTWDGDPAALCRTGRRKPSGGPVAWRRAGWWRRGEGPAARSRAGPRKWGKGRWRGAVRGGRGGVEGREWVLCMVAGLAGVVGLGFGGGVWPGVGVVGVRGWWRCRGCGRRGDRGAGSGGRRVLGGGCGAVVCRDDHVRRGCARR